MFSSRAIVLFGVVAASAYGSSVYSWSRVVLPSGTYDDYRIGDPATSAVSHADIRVDSSGGINYGAQASGSAVFGVFSMFASAGGNASENYESGAYARAETHVLYKDSITASGGLGPAIIRIPFLVEGAVDLSTSGGAIFGFTFCQSIPTGSQTGGVGCEVNGLPPYLNSQPPNLNFMGDVQQPVSQIFNLDFHVPFGTPFDLNYTVSLIVGAGGRIGSATGDFAHTGTQLPAQVFDQFGNLAPGATITSASGFNYFAPEAVATPEPGTLALAALGLMSVLWVSRNRLS